MERGEERTPQKRSSSLNSGPAYHVFFFSSFFLLLLSEIWVLTDWRAKTYFPPEVLGHHNNNETKVKVFFEH